eukprot:gnl/TRDRNA2_/TRDRNA2_197287_c0_seq1.p1 gnl/TRDRNA2_/TRDRNA2_197287_c0~~gnl/TRDRNA2_/TRDRNA2_197287_c0_seq1.p1  ORF type:complete len:331 (-),score=70.96 gnl/TRDRNA2_/TRDRNA2_197287_c0_seq1:46-1038(-)
MPTAGLAELLIQGAVVPGGCGWRAVRVLLLTCLGFALLLSSLPRIWEHLANGEAAFVAAWQLRAYPTDARQFVKPARTWHSAQFAAAAQPGEAKTADSAAETDAYEPKVSTWGMFPRPADISKAYGGGRTIRPGERRESVEEEEARKKRTADALLAYRKEQGLIIEPGNLEKFNEEYAEAELLLRSSAWEAAAEGFARAGALVPFRTTQGGKAMLQRAICIDSIGTQGDKARALYEILKKHPNADIQKQAKSLGFGFAAEEWMKFNGTSTFGINIRDYQPFFDRARRTGKETADWQASEGETETSLEDKLIAAGAIGLPFVLVAALQATS